MYLKEFRVKLNMTQKQFSEFLGIAQNAIARYENDKVKPTSTVILKYINKLNANPLYLFNGIEPIFLDEQFTINKECNFKVPKEIERIFFDDVIYSLDEVNLGLMLEINDSKVINIRTIQTNEDYEKLKFIYPRGKKELDLTGVKYFSIKNLENEIRNAYNQKNEEIIKTINKICYQTNELFNKNK